MRNDNDLHCVFVDDSPRIITDKSHNFQAMPFKKFQIRLDAFQQVCCGVLEPSCCAGIHLRIVDIRIRCGRIRICSIEPVISRPLSSPFSIAQFALVGENIGKSEDTGEYSSMIRKARLVPDMHLLRWLLVLTAG
ncbi:hypothetical protein RN04_02105 [Arthrobacter sp. W1]|nr:hypothetical protein RN04_02105 [Arthrobacter sp. W1]